MAYHTKWPIILLKRGKKSVTRNPSRQVISQLETKLRRKLESRTLVVECVLYSCAHTVLYCMCYHRNVLYYDLLRSPRSIYSEVRATD